jgi:putative addiction module CopG family antidote
MSIMLSEETGKLIEKSMREGGYATPDDVVRAGLESLKQQESLGDFEPGELDALIEEGERSGVPLDGDQVFAEMRELRNRAGGKK